MVRGDVVKLKEPDQGRVFEGKILKETDDDRYPGLRCFKVGLPNGLYVIRPKDDWLLCGHDNTDVSITDIDDDTENETDDMD